MQSQRRTEKLKNFRKTNALNCLKREQLRALDEQAQRERKFI